MWKTLEGKLASFFLDSHSQSVCVDGYSSDMQIIKHSVSQGALHCPKLLMCNMTKLINFILFYGETNIFCSVSEVNQLGNIVLLL